MRNWNDDPYTKKARAENFAARSAYKLEEINRKHQILKNIRQIIDLGASPGSWSQYCLKANPTVRIIAIDLNPLQIADSRITYLEGDIADINLSAVVEKNGVDLVLSDMAPKTSGNKARDAALSFELAELAFETAQNYLRQGGNFVVKLFMGEEFNAYRKLLSDRFSKVHLVRPQSTRKQSREIYFLGEHFAL